MRDIDRVVLATLKDVCECLHVLVNSDGKLPERYEGWQELANDYRALLSELDEPVDNSSANSTEVSTVQDEGEKRIGYCNSLDGLTPEDAYTQGWNEGREVGLAEQPVTPELDGGE